MSIEEFSLPIRVYIEDTDAGGIVYYVNYMKYMERARTEMMRTLGYDKDFIFNQSLMFVVREAQIEYLAPARLDDTVHASADIVELGAAYMVLEQTVSRDDNLLSRGRIKIVCVDRDNMKPKRLPRDMIATLRGETAR